MTTSTAENSSSTRAQLNVELVRDYLGWPERGDVEETLRRTWAERIAYHGRELGEISSRDGLAEMLGRFAGAMPDLKVETQSILSNDDYVVFVVKIIGTQAGDDGSGTVQATGETIEARGIDMWRVKDGKLVEQWIIEGIVDHNNPDRARVD